MGRHVRIEALVKWALQQPRTWLDQAPLQVSEHVVWVQPVSAWSDGGHQQYRLARQLWPSANAKTTCLYGQVKTTFWTTLDLNPIKLCQKSGASCVLSQCSLQSLHNCLWCFVIITCANAQWNDFTFIQFSQVLLYLLQYNTIPIGYITIPNLQIGQK